MKRILYVGNKLSSFGFTPTGIDFLGALLERNSYNVLFAGEKKSKVSRLLSIVWTIVVKRKSYDIIIVDTYSSSAFYMALVTAWTARLLHKPYIPVLRGGNLPDRLTRSPWLTEQVIWYASRVVSVSHYLQRIFSSIRPVDYIPNFIELKKYPFKERHKLKPRLLWVRSFHQIYNPELAVKIIAALKKEYPYIFLTMVGPDKDGSRARVEQLATQLGVIDNIRLTGRLSKAEWIALAADHDIFINTTNFDNMPVSVVEAMALGLPVVSTKVGGTPFLIKHHIDGILVPINDVEEFCKAIRKLLHEHEFAREVASAARLKVQEFDEVSVFTKWKKILDHV